MDSATYRSMVRARLRKELSKLRIRIAGEQEIKTAIRELTEQYLSICEAENFPRWKFSQKLLNRAYEACTYSDDTIEVSVDSVLRSSIRSYYPRALELTPELLDKVFQGKRHRKP